MPEPVEAGRDKAVFFLGASGGGWPANIWTSDFKLPKLWENTFLLT